MLRGLREGIRRIASHVQMIQPICRIRREVTAGARSFDMRLPKIPCRLVPYLFGLSVLLGQSTNPSALAEANRGVQEAQQNHFPAAIAAYRRAIALNPNLPGIYLNLGLAYFKQGDFQNALSAFAKERDKARSQRVSTLMAMSYFGLGRYKEAADKLASLAAAEPDNAELSYVLAKSYLWSRQFDKAEQLFQQLLIHDPDSAPAHMLLGEALDADEHTAEATVEFELAAKAKPDQPDVHFGLGYLYWKQHRYEDAERQFREELKTNPRSARASGYLGDCLLKAAHKAAAEVALRNSMEWQANLYVPQVDMGILQVENKQYEAARQHFLDAIQIDPKGYDAHYRLARLYREMGKTAQAQEQFAIVQKLHRQKDQEPLMKISGPQ
ncbi:MAG: tetratricopeptide repeat protein [Bryobacteraceae bacterium]